MKKNTNQSKKAHQPQITPWSIEGCTDFIKYIASCIKVYIMIIPSKGGEMEAPKQLAFL